MNERARPWSGRPSVTQPAGAQVAWGGYNTPSKLVSDMLAVVTLALSSPVPVSTATANAEWASWKAEHGKQYASVAEHELRRKVWMQTREEVLRHNAQGTSSWTAGLNAFSDLSWEEFKAEKLMTPQNCSATHTASGSWKKNLTVEELPDEVDWRDEIAKVAPWPVKNQGHCGSCWTFSTVGSMESHYILKHSAAKNLSEQQLVDCAGAFVRVPAPLAPALSGL